MNYPRSQLSKHLHDFLMTYGYCSICTTCAISGTSGRNTFNQWKLFKDDLKCYISQQNNYSKLLKQISDNIIIFICGYTTCAAYGTSGTN